jgi:hypothetical protein
MARTTAQAYNSAHDEEVSVEAGFLIVKAFPRLYAEHRDRYELRREVYAMPRLDREPEQCPIQYRGLDRDALDDWQDSEMDAELFLAMLEVDYRAVDAMVFSQHDVDEAFSLLGPLQSGYEIIWSRVLGSEVTPPEGHSSIGFEGTYFVSDHFSASCDCMLFPRWHGTDEEGTLFLSHFRQLNAYGLFPTPEAAQDFLTYYLSFDWTERGEFVIAEVFIRQ